MKKSIIFIICICICIAAVAGCAQDGDTSPASPSHSHNSWEIDPSVSPPPVEAPWERDPQGIPPPLYELKSNTIQATIKMKDGGLITLELYPDIAPQTVRNFVHLAKTGFYEGTKFHRIIKNFMVQGGGPKENHAGDPGYAIWGEFEVNGFINQLDCSPGVIAMSRKATYNSAGSQFFIMLGSSNDLGKDHAAFGIVIGGMDVVRKLGDTPNSGDDGAVAERHMPVIESITINDDVDLPLPEKIPLK